MRLAAHAFLTVAGFVGLGFLVVPAFVAYYGSDWACLPAFAVGVVAGRGIVELADDLAACLFPEDPT